jgi:tryptophan-rich sensory protein
MSDVQTTVEARQPPRRSWSFGALLAALGATAVAGAVGSLATNVDGWYEALNKPFFQPPNWLFAPVWSILYVIMAIAMWQAWRSAPNEWSRRFAATLFGIQLVLNALWSVVFFGFQQVGTAFGVIVALIVAILATMWAFSRIDHIAAYLMSPYLAWVVFATLLNGAILALN